MNPIQAAPPAELSSVSSAPGVIHFAAPERNDQWAVLAGLRGFLAIAVMLTHTFMLTTKPGGLYQSWGGTPAVLGFFFVSGYSICASLTREQSYYAERRVRRILPLYWLGLLIATVSIVLVGGHHISANNLSLDIPNWTILFTVIGLPNLFVALPNIVSPYWSLGCEIPYYAVGPWFLRQSDKLLLGLAGVSVFAFIGLEAMHHTAFQDYTHGVSLLTLLWAWLAGFVIYRSPKNAWAYVIGVMGVLCIDRSTAMVALALVATARTIKVSPKLAPILLYAGDVSYPLYIFHWITFWTIWCVVHRSLTKPEIIGAYLLAILVAMAAYHLIDRPIRAWDDRRCNAIRENRGAAGANG